MTIAFEGLIALRLRELVSLLASGNPAPDQLKQSQWLAIVQLLTARLSRECAGLQPADWRLSQEATDYVLHAAEARRSISAREVAERRLNLSVALLHVVPPNREVGLLNPAVAAEVFSREVPLPFEEAQMLTANWKRLDIAEIRRLRDVKNLLTPILWLVQKFPENSSLQALRHWEGIHGDLP
jgi:hypothetical protein